MGRAGNAVDRIQELLMKIWKEGVGKMDVRKSGAYRFLPSYRYEAHRHVEYEINYVLSGKCMMIFEEEYVPLKVGECIVIPPFWKHGFLVDAKSGCKIQQTEMSVEIPESMKEIFPFCDRKVPYRLIRDCEDLVPVMEQLSRHHRNDRETYRAALLDLSVLQLIAALGYHTGKVQNGMAGVRNEKIRDLMKYIQEHYHEPLQIEKLAAGRGISSRFVRRYFTEEIGMPCSAYIQTLRLNKAKELLWETDKSITGIALEVGYGTPQYFCRIFREEIGMSPSAYRFSWKEKQIKKQISTQTDTQ